MTPVDVPDWRTFADWPHAALAGRVDRLLNMSMFDDIKQIVGRGSWQGLPR